MTYEPKLLREAEIAFERGEKVTIQFNKREGKRFWKIYRERLVTSGEQDYEEED